MTIVPSEPAYASFNIRKQVLTINPVTTSLLLVALVFMGLWIYRWNRTGLQKEEGLLQPQIRELPVITPSPELQPKLAAIKARIISAYISVLEIVERITSIPMAPQNTLREFLETVVPLSPPSIQPFTELTGIAEFALYSTEKTDEDIAARADQLADNIKKELYRGTS